MLILSLSVGQRIWIGDVEVMLTSMAVQGMALRGGQAKIGIKAGPEIEIHRLPSGSRKIRRRKS